MDIPQSDLELIGFLFKSRYRVNVLRETITPLTPKIISTHIDVRLPLVSKALAELSSKKLVKCLNPDERKGKIYVITKLGKSIFKKYLKNVRM